MRKISVLTAVFAMTVGFGAVSTSAFADGCLTNQDSLTPMSLTHDDFKPNQGFGYDRDAYLAALAKGNAGPTTQQSQPVSDNEALGSRAKTHAYTSYN